MRGRLRGCRNRIYTTTICDGVASPQGACAVWCRVCSAPLPAAVAVPPPPGMRNVRDRCHRQSPFHHHYSPRVLSPSLRASRASGVCVRSLGPDLALKRPPFRFRWFAAFCFRAFPLFFFFFFCFRAATSSASSSEVSLPQEHWKRSSTHRHCHFSRLFSR